MNRARFSALIGCAFLLSASVYLACDSSDDAVKETAPDAAPPITTSTPTPDGSTPTPDAGDDCFMNPTTNFEIINACTDAVKVDKIVNLPLLYPDGGLPPAP